VPNSLIFNRNTTFRSLLVAVMLLSWLSMLVSVSCVMPMPVASAVVSDMPADCEQSMPHAEQHRFVTQFQDCAFKNCADFQSDRVFSFKLDKPQLPLLIFCLIWLSAELFSYYAPRYIPFIIRPPGSKPLPLFYRFCSLLN
jgi:hypothetical protein